MWRRRLSLLLLVFALASLAADTATMEPKELAARLDAKGSKPVLFYVGPAVMYRKHIPGAVFAGPASRPEGLNALKTAVTDLPRDGQVILYCGCCPWDMCPNVKPALELLKSMGFQKVKSVLIPTNFAKDWIDQGYPVEQQAAK